MIFLQHIFSGFEHVLTSEYGHYFLEIPFTFGIIYLLLYVLGGHKND